MVICYLSLSVETNDGRGRIDVIDRRVHANCSGHATVTRVIL